MPLDIMNKRIARDPFLNFRSAEDIADMECLCASDLDLPSDYSGLVKEYRVKENFSSFFHFYPSDFYSIEIEDIVDSNEYAITALMDNGHWKIFSNTFTIIVKTEKPTNAQKWDAINIACMLYLDLNLEKFGPITDCEIIKC